MIYLIVGLSFIFGLLIGSFLNVVVLRLNSKSISGRSMCMSCGKTLTWKELIPLFSFIFQKGRCVKCHSKISIQYPLVELVTGVMFALIGVRILGTFDFSFIHIVQFLLYADIAAILIALSVYDIYHFIIPNIFIWLLFAIFIVLLTIPGLFPSMSILTILSGPVVVFPFLLIWLFSGGRLIGFGDIKLTLVMGWILGVSGGIAMIALSVWIGAIIGILFILITRQKTLKVKIPFGPFLAIGGMLSLLYNIDIGTIIRWFI